MRAKPRVEAIVSIKYKPFRLNRIYKKIGHCVKEEQTSIHPSLETFTFMIILGLLL